MQLFDILKDIQILNAKDIKNVNIEGIEINSKKVRQNYVYVCLKGTKVDGHNFVGEASDNGATVIVTQKIIKSFSGIQVLVKNTRSALSYIAKNFYKINNMPDIIGITGTNGKTTTTFMVANILSCAEKNVGIIGTQGVFFKDYYKNFDMTTPDPLQLFKSIKEMTDLGANYIVMEVSAHSIALNKVDAINFKVKALTNITQDHLDFFKSLKKYKKCKENYIKKDDCIKVVNYDDDSGKVLLNNDSSIVGYSSKYTSDIYAFNINKECNKYSVNMFGELFDIECKIYGKYNISNALCAISICNALNIDKKYIIDGINSFLGADGRFNVIEKNGIKFVIDFAHTPDAFKNVMPVAKEMTEQNLYVVFGCGGNRDRGKRSKMGKIASELCDYVIVTEDNARFEDIQSICKDITKGIKKNNYEIIHNRIDAIKKAYKLAKSGDIILVLGKGAEPYIERNGEKFPYCDKDVINQLTLEDNWWK